MNENNKKTLMAVGALVAIAIHVMAAIAFAYVVVHFVVKYW